MELKSAGIECAMLTGDSVYTGMAVGKAVAIIPPASQIVIGTINPKTRVTEWRQENDALVTEESLANDPNITLCVTGEVYASLRAHGGLDPPGRKCTGEFRLDRKPRL